MEALEWIRFFLVLAFLVSGLAIFLLEIFGVFRFKFVLNRMQIAATGDTLGISLCMTGLIIANGFNFTSAKMVLVIIFLWFASPVSSHVIARLEAATDRDLEKHCRILKLEDLEKELEEQDTQRDAADCDLKNEEASNEYI